MSIADKIKAMPDDEDLVTIACLSDCGDGYVTDDTGITTTELKAYVERHEARIIETN